MHNAILLSSNWCWVVYVRLQLRQRVSGRGAADLEAGALLHPLRLCAAQAARALLHRDRKQAVQGARQVLAAAAAGLRPIRLCRVRLSRLLLS